MTSQNGGRPAPLRGSRPSQMLNIFGGVEPSEISGVTAPLQAMSALERARLYEAASRRNAVEALKHPGVAGLQLLGLAGHYARQARDLMRESGR